MLLREAHDLCGLPVSVFRCDLILADTTYSNQLNLPDMFTRLIPGLVATGVAPDSFYQLDAAGQRQRAHYDGCQWNSSPRRSPTIGAHVHSDSVSGFETYHVMNPHDVASASTSSSTGSSTLDTHCAESVIQGGCSAARWRSMHCPTVSRRPR